MDRRNRVNDSVTHFTNQCYLHDSKGEGRYQNPANSSGVRSSMNGACATNDDDAAHDFKSDQVSRRIISNGIRQLATEERTLQTQNNKSKSRSCYSKSIGSLIIILILAPIGISAYVYLQHREMVSAPCQIGK